MCSKLEPDSGSTHAISSTVRAFTTLPCEREVDTQIGGEEGKLAEAILEMNAETIKSIITPFLLGRCELEVFNEEE